MNLFKSIKNKLNEWLEIIAKSNEEQFGKDKLSCCNMSKNKSNNLK